MTDATMLDSLGGDPMSVDLEAAGPWMAAPAIDATRALEASAAGPAMSARLAADEPDARSADTLGGTLTLHNANWKADYLASHVLISQATLHVGNGEIRWDPVAFSYGPVKGTASLDLPQHCAPVQHCQPTFQVQFGELDAAALQAAILGAHEKGTLLSTLIARLRPADAKSAPSWPPLQGTVQADSLMVGPVTLAGVKAEVHIRDDGAEIAGLEASLLGGRVHGSGTLTAASGESKPAYSAEFHFDKLNPAAVGQVMGLNWTGRTIDADGKIDLSGFTGEDLAASAKGALHFDWRHGVVPAQEEGKSRADAAALALTRFDRWTADAEIARGAVTLKQSEVQEGGRKWAIAGTLTLGDPAKANFAVPKQTQARR
jgi:hypothetical protein